MTVTSININKNIEDILKKIDELQKSYEDMLENIINKLESLNESIQNQVNEILRFKNESKNFADFPDITSTKNIKFTRIGKNKWKKIGVGNFHLRINRRHDQYYLAIITYSNNGKNCKKLEDEIYGKPIYFWEFTKNGKHYLGILTTGDKVYYCNMYFYVVDDSYGNCKVQARKPRHRIKLNKLGDADVIKYKDQIVVIEGFKSKKRLEISFADGILIKNCAKEFDEPVVFVKGFVIPNENPRIIVGTEKRKKISNIYLYKLMSCYEDKYIYCLNEEYRIDIKQLEKLIETLNKLETKFPEYSIKINKLKQKFKEYLERIMSLKED